MPERASRARVLHVCSGEATGAGARRRAALIEHWGTAAMNVLVEADDARAAAVQSSVRSGTLPNLTGRPWPNLLQPLAEALQAYDLILTYGWSARNAVLAHTLFAARFGLPPLIHHEFDALPRMSAARRWARMVALARTAAVVVPSGKMARVAVEQWRLPPGKVHPIAFGVDSGAFARRPRPDALPRVIKRPGERFIAVVAEADGSAPLSALLRALEQLPESWQLVILGRLARREQLLDDAVRRKLGHRLHVPGTIADWPRVAGLFDLFVDLAGPAGDPLPALAAAAAGAPVLSRDDGPGVEVPDPAGGELLFTPGGDDKLCSMIVALGNDDGRRERLGAANRQRVRDHHDRRTMLMRYDALFAEATERRRFP